MPIQQPLQERSISKKMLQELESHRLAGGEHGDCTGRLCPGPRAAMGWRCHKPLFAASTEPDT